jgi:hypothetical protein
MQVPPRRLQGRGFLAQLPSAVPRGHGMLTICEAPGRLSPLVRISR